MMTVYLHCEGVTDYAVIPILMKKVIGLHNVDIQWIKRATLNNIKTHRKSGIIITSHYKLINALATHSFLNDIKHIAYHQDADRKFNEIYNTIEAEFCKLREKGFNCLAIVPKEMTESWLLSDENAFPAIPKEPKLPARPEELWGQKNNPQSDHPYNYFVRVLTQFNLPDNRGTYTQIAEKTDITVLKQRCPKSFGKFYSAMQTFAENIKIK